MEKVCFKCEMSKPLDDFYPHPRMADGHLNKCKSCTKRDMHDRYGVTRDARRNYERAREATEGRKAWCANQQRLRRQREPEKVRARDAVARAIRAGRLVRLPCERCSSETVEAHHDDYTTPLIVRWLCPPCHRESAHGRAWTPNSSESVNVPL